MLQARDSKRGLHDVTIVDRAKQWLLDAAAASPLLQARGALPPKTH